MPSITSVLTILKSAYPQFSFLPADQARWDPATLTVYYEVSDSSLAELFHELAHGLLGHATYRRDIELIGIERDAWEHALQLASTYNVQIDQETIEDALDSYREWLHARSLCPTCSATGIQASQSTYTCLVCQSTWRVNEAKTCALRRYKINPR